MDEVIRIYNPKGNYLVAEVPKKIEEEPVKRIVNKKEKRYSTLNGIFEEYKKEEKELREKYPLFNLFYNYLAAGVLVALLICSIICGVQARNEHKVRSLVAIAMADYDAEQQAIQLAAEEARQQEIEKAATAETTIMKNEANYIAKLLYGARHFEDKYGYSTDDFMTLAWCVLNRVDNKAFPNTVKDVVQQDKQWVGYSDANDVTDKFFKIAYTAVEEWHHNDIKPITNDYAWAELTSRGCYLKNDYEAGVYSIRWRYSS